MSERLPGLVDIHCHYVPRGFPGAPDAAAGPRWPCLCHREGGAAMLEIGDKPFRLLDERSWSAERRIADMDRDGVTRQALSPMPELLSYWLEATATAELARHVNAAIAEVVARRPDRFSGLGMVPMQDPARAVEMLPGLRADGLSGIEIGSNVNGLYLGEPRFEPVFAALAEFGMAVFIHALHPLQAPHLASFPDLTPFAGFVTDTGLSASTLIMSGLLERHPTLRIALSHGGGVLAPIVHRMEHGWRETKGFAGRLALSPKTVASRLYLDSLTYDGAYARHLATLSPGNICLGTDYPYLIEQKDPATFISQVADGEQDPIWSAAADRFLGLRAA
jgi:aminocarboxymuconate-semialdehyde decarboxylase